MRVDCDNYQKSRFLVSNIESPEVCLMESFMNFSAPFKTMHDGNFGRDLGQMS